MLLLGGCRHSSAGSIGRWWLGARPRLCQASRHILQRHAPAQVGLKGPPLGVESLAESREGRLPLWVSWTAALVRSLVIHLLSGLCFVFVLDLSLLMAVTRMQDDGPGICMVVIFKPFPSCFTVFVIFTLICVHKPSGKGYCGRPAVEPSGSSCLPSIHGGVPSVAGPGRDQGGPHEEDPVWHQGTEPQRSRRRGLASALSACGLHIPAAEA